ncbi:MAG: DUF4347 domain-containing protein, partial [Bacteroidota bacterium]
MKIRLLLVTAIFLTLVETGKAHGNLQANTAEQVSVLQPTDDTKEIKANATISTPSFLFIDQEIKDAETLQSALLCEEAKSTFHLFTHGQPGALWIEGSWKNAPQIASWLQQRSYLDDKLQLNIYGCNFAKGEEGRAAVVFLEKQLSVSIAASDDITGRDGDWHLEVGDATISELLFQDYVYNLSITSLWGNFKAWVTSFLVADEVNIQESLSASEARTAATNQNLQPALASAQLMACAGTVGGTGPGDDFDGDGVCNNVDDDDDNDGILDSDEGSFNCSGPVANGVIASVGTTGNNAQINDGSTVSTQGPGFNSVGDRIIIDLGILIPSGTQILFDFRQNGPEDNKNLRFAQLPDAVFDIGGGTNGQVNSNPDNTREWTYTYTLNAPTRYIQVRMTVRQGGITYIREATVLTCSTNDIDNDGIAGQFDLDTDNDGCPDAIEGAAGFTILDIDANDRLTGGVDGNGVPTVATASGQGVGDSQDPSTQDADCVDPCDPIASGNLDTDGDGITDFCDLDDDNDGILDEDECPLAVSSGLSGAQTYTFDISSTNPNGNTIPHTLNSITIGGTTYTDF